ncbi:MAG TPA: DUF4142 domain-containing protein [Ramlibacter sp.]|jgi:putative membrane protein|uniref:DUF4142 domain-containing protein n=1 Tax=Ramlibacter sp. TaxID=1917967 RepID=UPI002D45EC15|nr:DUF4142 domain-containing protein [Ramlibacter sp.]HZY20422.1 DUF4142 domain-containing protein [Ramlibacter sp.]
MSRVPHFIVRAVLAAAVAGGVATLSGCAGMSHTTAGASAATRLSAEDHVFAMQAAGGGQYEVLAGQLAIQRAANADVRGFGQMLVDHHTAANAELASLLQARGLVPPSSLPSQYAAKLARLNAAPAAAFDAQFVRTAGLEDHQVQIGLFEQASREVRDPALKAWFVRTLPTLRSHLQAAQVLAGSLAG